MAQDHDRQLLSERVVSIMLICSIGIIQALWIGLIGYGIWRFAMG